jgi:hypothetical protein
MKKTVFVTVTVLVRGALAALLVAVLALGGCDTSTSPVGGNSGGNSGNDNMGAATELTIGQWTSNTAISPTGDIDWYKFTAVSGKTYLLTWDDGATPNSGTYTGDIMVTVYQSDGSTILKGIDCAGNGYASRIISGYTGTVYVKVQAYQQYSWSTPATPSTYIIKYEEGDGNDSMMAATTLVDGVWTNDTAINPAGDIDWYKFTASPPQTYTLTWDDGDSPYSGTYTGDIMVTVYQADGSTIWYRLYG